MTREMTADVSPREPLTGAVAAMGFARPITGDAAGPDRVPASLWTDELGWDDRRVVVVEPSGMRALGTAAAMEGYLWVPIEPPRPLHRGKLALHIEECIESALQARGAPFPGVGASTDLDASLGDQLYRARLVEMRGIALGVPDLGGIVSLGGVLDAEDSAALRWWVAAAMDRPVRVVLSAENRAYRIYPSPVPFGTLLDGLKSTFTDAPSPRAPSAEMAQSVAAMELSDLPPEVTAADDGFALGAGVALPELDRALGLEPEEETSAVDPVAAEHELSVAESLTVESEPERSTADVVAADSEPEPSAAESPATEAESGISAVRSTADDSERESEPELSAAEVLVAEREEQLSAAESCAVESTVTEPASAEAPSPEENTAEASCRQASSEAAAAESPRIDAESNASAGGAEEGSEAALLAALSSPEAPAVVEQPKVDTAPKKPIIKSILSPLATRRSLGAKRPFIMPADDEPEPESFASAEDSAASKDAPVAIEATPAQLAETVDPPRVRASEPSEETAVAPRDSSELQASAEPNAEVMTAEASAPPAAAPAEDTPPAVESARAVAEEDREDRFDAYARDNWEKWVRELESAKGPKPLAVVERLFVTAYTRLDAAVQRGIGDERAVAALDQWRTSFIKSYTEAFDALRLRGKRPTMVLDVPELAQRIGRLHGARRVLLVLVDAMRFDLGVMVQERLKQRAEATLAERLLLWSALPTTTTNQIELIGKGPDGLKDMAPRQEEAAAVVARGRAAQNMRRIRTGRRELLKLDLVEAALREQNHDGDMQSLRERLTAVADEVAVALTECMAKQPPRTLVMVFGDHGFRLHREGGAGRLVSQGGASPEEVLVPGFAWLTGAVH